MKVLLALLLGERFRDLPVGDLEQIADIGSPIRRPPHELADASFVPE